MLARETDRNSGWIHLLPPLAAAQRILCVEAGAVSSSSSLEYWIDEFTSWTVDGDGPPTLPFAARSFELVACRMLGTELNPVQFRTLIQECARVLSAEGGLYIDVSSDSWTSRIGLFSSVVRCLADQGFVGQRSWPILLERGVIAEVLPSTGYRSCRNSWRKTERVKEWAYGPTARWLAPGHAFLASRRAALPCVIEQLGARDAAKVFTRFLLNPGKSFFQATRRGESIPELYVLPGDLRTVERRRAEFAAIERIRGAGLTIQRLLPRVCAERELNGRPLFAIEAFDGVTIDLPVDGLESLFSSAAAVLVTFNRDTARSVRIDAEIFQMVIGRAANAAIDRYPAVAEALSSLRDTLGAALLEQERTLVWMHGDYKLENLIFDRRSRAVQAVIDWELSSELGMPLTDLLYLVAYLEITLGHVTDILDVVESGLPDKLPLSSRRLVESYVRQFGLSFRDCDLARGVFLMHHVGARFAYDPSNVAVVERIGRIATAVEARIRSSNGVRP